MNEKGYSLISIVIVFFILSLLGLSVLWVTYNQRSKVNKDYDNLSAIYAAESGIEYMKAVINNELNSDDNNKGNDKENHGNRGHLKQKLRDLGDYYSGHKEDIERDKYFIIKNISVLDNSGNGNGNGNNDSSYVVSIASEGHAGKQVYTAYAKLVLDISDNLNSLSIQTWKVIRGIYKPAVFNNL